MAVMPAAGSHAPGDDDGASPSSSSSPDRGGARPHRFTPSESSNDDNGGNGRSGIVYSRGREGAGLWAGDGVLTDDGVGIEAYELRDIAVAVGRGRGSLTDGDDNDDNDDDDNDDDDDEEDEGSDDGLMDSRIVYTAEEERAVVRKFDRRLVLFVALLYMLSFLDRSNIGNAYTAGMDEDLLQTTDPVGAKHGSSPDYYYEWALTAFYIAYMAFEWLALLWAVIPAHVYVSAIVLSWGVLASLQAVARSYPWLIALRFLLGIGEAGFTGIPIYLSFFFRREELALRTAVFVSAAPLATAFASFLAWVIVKLGENGPIAPWRLLFLVEGFPAVIVATLAWRIVPDSPGQARYLTKREKKIACQRLLSNHASGKGNMNQADTNHDDDYDDMDSDCTTRCCGAVLQVLADPVPWTTAGIFFLTNVAYSSLPVFLPSILTQMGHSALAAQALAAPPYIVSFLVLLAVAALSDALRSRSYLIMASALVSAAGYAFLALSETLSKIWGGGGGSGGMLDMARYLAIYPAAAGFFCVAVLTISLNVNNARGDAHKGGGFVLMQSLGQCGPLVGTHLFPKTDGPWFTGGFGTCAGAMLGVAGLAMALRWHLARKNRRLDAEDDVGHSDEEEGLVGGRSDGGYREKDDFRYML